MITRYRDYIVRASDHHLQSLQDLASRNEQESSRNVPAFLLGSTQQRDGDHVLQEMVDGFFSEASKYSAGLLGIDRFFKLLKVGQQLHTAGEQSSRGERVYPAS